MTRDEALEKLRAIVTGRKGFVSDRSIEMSLDGYVALGMLKLDEPKSAYAAAGEIIVREVAEWNMVRSGSVLAADVSTSLLRAFDRAGLQIVEK